MNDPEDPTATLPETPAAGETPGDPAGATTKGRDRGDLPTVAGFRMYRSLGVGGMGSVYLAKELNLDRFVAIKFNESPHQKETPEQRRRFVREGQTMVSVKHQNLASVHWLEDKATPQYMVMEYVEGKTLNHHLAAKGRFPEAEALEILRQCVAGLGAVWGANIAHRDVKPDNILLDRTGQVKVVDFGLARPDLVGYTVSEAGTLVGTWKYMAPERFKNARGDARTDIYALGLVLFRILTGSDAFRGETHQALYHSHMSEPLPDARELEPGISEGTQRLMVAMTAKEPDERPGTAGELLEWIDALLAPVRPRVLDRLKGLAHRLMQAVGARERGVAPYGSAVPTVGGRTRLLVGGLVAVAVIAVVWLGISQWSSGSVNASVQIESFPPGAEVLVDGTSIGTTPLRTPLAQGSEVVLRKPGYEGYRAKIETPEEALSIRLTTSAPDLSSPPTAGQLIAVWRSLSTGVFEWGVTPTSDLSSVSSETVDGGVPLVRLETERPVHVLFFSVLPDGTMVQLAPLASDSLLAVERGEVELPVATEVALRLGTTPQSISSGRFFVFGSSAPIDLPVPTGALSLGSSVVYPPSQGQGSGAIYPGRQRLETLIGLLNASGVLEWDLEEVER